METLTLRTSDPQAIEMLRYCNIEIDQLKARVAELEAVLEHLKPCGNCKGRGKIDHDMYGSSDCRVCNGYGYRLYRQRQGLRDKMAALAAKEG